jgi:hypothetical protein
MKAVKFAKRVSVQVKHRDEHTAEAVLTSPQFASVMGMPPRAFAPMNKQRYACPSRAVCHVCRRATGSVCAWVGAAGCVLCRRWEVGERR